MKRRFYTTRTALQTHGYSTRTVEERYEVPEAEATLVSSHVQDTRLHAPVLDIDFEARLVPSSTPGHYHLFLDKAMSWGKYCRLMKALYKAGVIEKGFYKMSAVRGASFVRTKPTKGKEGDNVLPPEYQGVKRLRVFR